MASRITSTDPEKFTKALLKKMQNCTGEFPEQKKED